MKLGIRTIPQAFRLNDISAKTTGKGRTVDLWIFIRSLRPFVHSDIVS